MKTKQSTHTPAPWTFDETWALIKGPNGEEIAAIHAAQDGTRRVHPHVAHLNARLIAAAPFLKEALLHISRECAETPSELSEAALGVIQIIARAAIAKAEGQEG